MPHGVANFQYHHVALHRLGRFQIALIGSFMYIAFLEWQASQNIFQPPLPLDMLHNNIFVTTGGTLCANSPMNLLVVSGPS
jgi:hypothetical protein